MQSLLRDQDTLEQGIERGIEQGIEQGRFEEKIEMAKNGLENNIPIGTISVMTGLSIEEVSEITELTIERLTSLRLGS